VIANLVGAHAHAAAHGSDAAHTECHHHDTTAGPAGDGHVLAAQHEHCKDTIDHTKACDFLCNGGVAILTAAFLTYQEPAPPPASAIAPIVHSTLPALLERPPRPSAHA
jgi:hypothetical protein